MNPDDPTPDPRRHRLPPTQEEVEAWAAREHARRAAWLEGPTAMEKADRAQKARERAERVASGPHPEPSPEDIEAWAERVRQARRAWLEGPSVEEKRQWASERARRVFGPPPELAPVPEEAEEWARDENRRRREWLAGPTEAEKVEWARGQAGGSPFGRWQIPEGLASERELLASLLREVEAASASTMWSFARTSRALWTYLKRTGRRFEERASGRRSRVPYP